MRLSREDMDRLVYDADVTRRFTQDSPVLPDVWMAYGFDPAGRVELLLTPHRKSTPGKLRSALEDGLAGGGKARRRAIAAIPGSAPAPVANESYVMAALNLEEMVRRALPLSGWWWNYVWKPTERAGGDTPERFRGMSDLLADTRLGTILIDQLVGSHIPPGRRRFSDDLLHLARVAGVIRLVAARGRRRAGASAPGRFTLPDGWQTDRSFWHKVLDELLGLVEGMDKLEPPPDEAFPLWLVNRNRSASTAVNRSRRTVKADAAQQVFSLSCRDLRWAIVDTGIDARHPAFLRAGSTPGRERFPANSRVVKTYDFTRLRAILSGAEGHRGEDFLRHLPAVRRRELRDDLRRSLVTGRTVDWDLLEPALLVPHDDTYRPPVQGHGTHVAGIMAGNWILPGSDGDDNLVGLCPDLELLDIRVLDDEGRGDEFTVIAALQFIRHLNAHADAPVIHGVNLSLAIPHDISNYACGQTPVCEECERLVGNGVVVVAAAGNRGYYRYLDAAGELNEDYRFISITDPGNAEGVITVGATHRSMPHTYGVSYFSSRGPTGDGRRKPDLVAPGEKIKGPLPGEDVGSLDGTSMAAPHVSGAAALLLARHRELIGKPARVKELLGRTATDLGREPFFQGNGLLDVLRSLQAI